MMLKDLSEIEKLELLDRVKQILKTGLQKEQNN